MYDAWADRNQRGTAPMRSKLALCATSQKTAGAVAPVCLQRECRVRVGGHSWHIAPLSYIED